jgi:hypothetical protein
MKLNIEELLKDPEKAKHKIGDYISSTRNSDVFPEDVIVSLKDPGLALLYVLFSSKRKFSPELEDIIATSAHSAFNYAYRSEKPFPKGENAIAESDLFSLMYARDVLHDRFLKGEYAIIKGEKKFLESYMDFLKEIGKLDEFLKDHPEVKL